MQQLSRALQSVPDPVRQHGLRAAHVRPLAGYRTADGGIRSARMTPARAWRCPYVGIEDAGAVHAALVFDCDEPDAMLDGLQDLPPFNWMTRTPSGGAHVAWTLAQPVAKHKKSHLKPLAFLAHIERYYQDRLSADGDYAHALTHNPVGERREHVAWGREEPYSLTELAKVIPLGWTPPRVLRSGVGRNVTLFKSGMAWAGRRENERLEVLAALMVVNQDFTPPLHLSEVRATAKSIEKYRRRWSANGWHSTKFRERQAARGRKGGLKSKRPPGPQPWIAAGVSRATWYRRGGTNPDQMALV